MATVESSRAGAPAPRAEAAPQGKTSRLWWWVGAVFAVQLAAWVAWFIIAAHHPVDEVPLVRTGR